MNRTQALSALQRIYGKGVLWRYDEGAPNADEREELRATLPALRSRKEAATAARMARRAELLADPLYRELLAAEVNATALLHEAQSTAAHYRVTVLTDGKLFHRVEVQADNWQDAVDKARGSK